MATATATHAARRGEFTTLDRAAGDRIDHITSHLIATRSQSNAIPAACRSPLGEESAEFYLAADCRAGRTPAIPATLPRNDT